MKNSQQFLMYGKRYPCGQDAVAKDGLCLHRLVLWTHRGGRSRLAQGVQGDCCSQLSFGCTRAFEISAFSSGLGG